jgi:hypothetical protein
VDIEGADHGSGLHQMRDHVVDLGKMFLVIPLRVFFGFPEAERENAVRLHIRRQDSLVEKSRLLTKNRQDLLVDSICKLVGLSCFGGNFNDACEHKFSPFVRLQIERSVARIAQRST